MTNNNYRLTERIEINQDSELEAINMRIINHYANIERQNRVNQTWEDYKANYKAKGSFIDFIRNMPESVKAEINFEQLKVNLGLDLVL